MDLSKMIAAAQERYRVEIDKQETARRAHHENLRQLEIGKAHDHLAVFFGQDWADYCMITCDLDSLEAFTGFQYEENQYYTKPAEESYSWYLSRILPDGTDKRIKVESLQSPRSLFGTNDPEGIASVQSENMYYLMLTLGKLHSIK